MVPRPFFGAGKPAWGRNNAGRGGGILQSVLPHPTDKIQIREKMEVQQEIEREKCFER